MYQTYIRIIMNRSKNY